MRVWERIKINDIVSYKDEKYIVQEIYKEESITYGILKKLTDGSISHVRLNACMKEAN